MIKMLLVFVLFFGAFAQAADQGSQNRILYLMQAGQTTSALDLYRAYQTESGKHDYELLQNMALCLLDQGYRSGNCLLVQR